MIDKTCVNIIMEKKTREELRKLAIENQRTLSGQILFILRKELRETYDKNTKEVKSKWQH